MLAAIDAAHAGDWGKMTALHGNEIELVALADAVAEVRRVVLSIEGEDPEQLQRVSAARGETPGELIAELLREADRSAA